MYSYLLVGLIGLAVFHLAGTAVWLGERQGGDGRFESAARALRAMQRMVQGKGLLVFFWTLQMI